MQNRISKPCTCSFQNKPIVVKEEEVEVHYSVSPKGRKTGNVSKPKESIRDSIKRVMHLRKANPSTNQIRYSK